MVKHGQNDQKAIIPESYKWALYSWARWWEHRPNDGTWSANPARCCDNKEQD